MKKVFGFLFAALLASCSVVNVEETKVDDAQAQLEIDLEMYKRIWNAYLAGDQSVISTENFTEDVVVVTGDGNIEGIDDIRVFYANYLTGFSEIEWNIVDAFGQGNRIVKQWHFKGKHTGEFFGIPASGNYLDLSGTTVVTMRDGRVAKEHDFFDMKTMLDQLTESEGDVVIDVYQPENL